MITRVLIVGVIATAFMTGSAALAQVPQQAAVGAKATSSTSTADRVNGEITAIDTGQKELTLKSSAGKLLTVTTDKQTLYRRVPPGEITLAKATVIAFADIGVGDRAIVRGKLIVAGIAAQALIVVGAQDIKEKEKSDKADWKKRGIHGTIVGKNLGSQALMVRTMTANGPAPLHITTEGRDVRYLRYGPDAVTFSDAKPSSFDDLAFGDQIRALGNKSPDGRDFLAEEIIFGSFQMVGGTITDVNRETGEVKIIDVKTKKPFTILLSKDSKVRRLPPELLKQMEETMAAAPPPSGGMRIGPGGASPSSGPAPQPQPQPQPGQRVMMPGQSPGGAGPAASGPAIDYGEKIENLPAITIADLKVGDGIIMSSTKGADPTRATAILLAAGLESFLKRHEANTKGSAVPLDLALPGIGGP